MTALYRGCKIKAERLRGDVYWSAVSQPHGYEIIRGCGCGNVREMFEEMKIEVDFFVEKCGGNVERHRKHFFRNL